MERYGMLKIITAFRTEAQPYIDHYYLQRDQTEPDLQVYVCDGIVLGICGKGRENAAMMAQYLAGSKPAGADDLATAWLNFGIAGAASPEVGELVCARSVTSMISGQEWILPLARKYHGHTGDVYTVDRAVSTYEANHIYDMESAGILEAIGEKSLPETILIAKLVSDGPQSPVESLTRQSIRDQIGQRSAEIVALADMLLH
jgi:hypothetical protein